MKKFILNTLFLTCGLVAFSQTDSTTTAPDIPRIPEVPIAPETVQMAEDTSVYDTSVIKMKRTQILIITPEGEENITIGSDSSSDHSGGFGFAGLILGLNGYVNNSNSLTLDDKYEFLELDNAKSTFVKLNLFEQDFSIYKKYVKGYIGLGIEFNNYRFKNNYRIIAGDDSLEAYKDTITDYSKVKLTSTYLDVPLMLEFNTSEDWKKAIHIGIGAYAGVRIGSKMKYVYEENGRKHKDKTRDDFHLNSFRYGLMAKIGYRNVNFFATYALSTMFEKGKGPEAYPVNVGVMLIGF